MAVDTVKSQSITNRDATPQVFNSAGQGAAGNLSVVEDFATTTVTGLQSTGSTYKLCSVPTNAFIKRVTVWSDTKLDAITSAPTLQLDFNLIFSDAASPQGDSTPTWLQGLIPNTANTGGTTTISSYSAPNIIFGQLAVSTTGYKSGNPVGGAGTAALGPCDLTLNGSRTNYPLATLMQEPLYQVFGFTDGRGNPADPGGYFDLMAYVSTAAATGVAAKIYAQVEYITQ